MSEIGIVGGGPVGLYLAYRLAQSDHKITVFEKKTWPVDKVCGQGIMPSGAERLSQMGIDFDESDSFKIQGIEYISDNQIAQGDFDKPALGIERNILSHKLYSMLKENDNVILKENSPVTKIQKSKSGGVQLSIAEAELKFDYVFCCDGMHSKTREQLGVTKSRKKRLRMGARVHFDIAPWSRYVQVYWSHEIEAYVTPVSDSKVEVAFLWFKSSVASGGHLEERLFSFFPELKKRLDVSKKDGDFKAYGPFAKYSGCINVDNVFFVGDAYCFKDGITGEGVSLGIKVADILAENFRTFGFWPKLHIKILYISYRFWIALALFMSRSPSMRRYAVSFLRGARPVFNYILKLNDYSFNVFKKLY